MTEEKVIEPVVSESELKRIKEEPRDWDARITLGFLVRCRTEGKTLQEIYNEAISEQLPGDDYKKYVYSYDQAFEFLSKNSELFKIKVD